MLKKMIDRRIAFFEHAPNSGVHFFSCAVLGLLVGGMFILPFYFLKPVATNPRELLGCLAYIEDIGITNRLWSLAGGFILSNLAFILFIGSAPAIKVEAFGLRLLARISSVFNKLAQNGAGWLSRYFSEQSRIEAKWFFVCLGASFLLPKLLVFLIQSFGPLCAPAVAPSFWEPFCETLQIGLFIFPAIAVFFWVRYPSLLKNIAFYLQIVILLFYVVLLPAVAYDGSTYIFLLPVHRIGLVAVCCFVVGFFDVVRRRNNQWESFFSPWAIFAILLGLTTASHTYPEIGSFGGAFEKGTRLPNYWMVAQGLTTLFKDTYLTYGLYDALGPVFGTWFYGGFTVASALNGEFLFLVFLKAIAFALCYRRLPTGLLLLLFVIASRHPLAIIFFIPLTYRALLNRPDLWLLVWAGLSCIFPFLYIPHGTIYVVASLPFAVFQAYRGFRLSLKRMIPVCCCGIVLASVLLWYPFGDYFGGLIRIYLETAQVNSHWAANFSRKSLGRLWNPILFTAVATYFWLPMFTLTGSRYINASPSEKNNAGRLVTLLLFSFTFLSLLLYMSYSFSRMDSRILLRNGIVSSSISGIVLLTFIVYRLPRKQLAISLLLFAPLLWVSPRSFVAVSTSFPRVPAASFTPSMHLGNVFLYKGYLQELQTVKEALDKVLQPEETFLDLTMENLNYLTADRKLWTEYPNYFCYVGDVSQRRAIEVLQKHRVRVSLLDGSIVFDRSPLSLRAYYLYRYAVLQGQPWKINPKKVLLMPADYFSKADIPVPSRKEAIALLDEQFPPLWLGKLPQVWGRQAARWEKDFPLVLQLPPLIKASSKQVIELPQGFEGAKAGLLFLDIELPSNVSSATFNITWQSDDGQAADNAISLSAKTGRLVIPIDAAPRWLLARELKSITISSRKGRVFTIKRASLHSRI